MAAISFKRGEPVCLRAKKGFNCGDLERQVDQGDEVWFDGYSVDFGDGISQLYPKLKSAIRAGWLGLAEDVPVVEDLPQEEAPAFMMTVIDHEEQVVGQVMDPKEIIKRNAEAFFEGREDLVRPRPRLRSLVAEGAVHAAAADNIEGFFHPKSQSPKPQKTASHTRDLLHMPLVSDEPEGVVIGSVDQFATATKASALSDDQREEMLIEALGPEADAVKAVQKARRIREGAAKADAPAPSAASARRDARSAEATKAQQTVESEEAKVVTIGPGIQWDMSRAWTARAKDAVDTYGDYPGLIKGIMAVEIDAVQKRIAKTLSERE